MTDAQRLVLVRAVHIAIYVVMAGSIFALLYAGLFGAQGAWVWGALALAGVETVIFVGSGMKCPMTAMAEKYGAKAGADTFMPERLTRHTLRFFGPLLVISLLLLAARWSGFVQ